MKKLMSVVGVFLLLAVAAQSATVSQVVLVQTTGSSAYVAGGDLTWSMGTSGTIYDQDFNAYAFSGATVTATFSGLTDLSSGGVAKAKFSSGTWSMSLTDGSMSVNLAGTIQGNYIEEELWQNNVCGLDGRAVVKLSSAMFTGFPQTFEWGNSKMLGGIIASVVFPKDVDITDYTTGYGSENLTVTLVADETSIPEPATMLLLGLGGVLLRKKK